MLCETLANCGEALPFRPSAPVQGRLYDLPAKSNFLAVGWISEGTGGGRFDLNLVYKSLA